MKHENKVEQMKIPIIGQLKQAEEEREALRFAMRVAKKAEDKAQNKREYRKARNRVECIKKVINQCRRPSVNGIH